VPHNARALRRQGSTRKRGAHGMWTERTTQGRHPQCREGASSSGASPQKKVGSSAMPSPFKSSGVGCVVAAAAAAAVAGLGGTYVAAVEP